MSALDYLIFVILSEYEIQQDFVPLIKKTIEAYTCEMSHLLNRQTKPMPPLPDLAKKLESLADRVESGASGAEQKTVDMKSEEDIAYQEDKDGAEHSSLGETVKLKAPDTHAERVESLFGEREEVQAEQEENREDRSSKKHLEIDPRISHLPRTRGFEESKPSHSDDSASSASRVEGCCKDLSATGDQLGAIVTSGRPNKAAARDSDFELGSDDVRSKGPSISTPGPRIYDKDIPLESIESPDHEEAGQWELSD